jgi:hypothetical protein
MAGIFLSQFAGKDEITESGYGWVAFEARAPFNDSLLLNSRIMQQPVAYSVDSGFPHDRGSNPPAAPSGFIPLATFNLASELFPGYSWFTVFGRPDSIIGRSGVRYLQYRLFELPPPQPYSASAGLEHVKIDATDLFAHSPSGANFWVDNGRQPVVVVTTPSFAADVPTTRTDGVMFELYAEGGASIGDISLRPRKPRPSWWKCRGPNSETG